MSQMLRAWLKNTPPYEHSNPFEMAVAQGLAAQDSVAAALRDAFLLGEPELPQWLVAWAASLTAKEVAVIEAGRDAEQAALREYVDQLMDDPAEWTEADRLRAAELGRRLSAITLVLRAREEAMAAKAAKAEGGEDLDKTIFLPPLAENLV